jgi:hypothetical protein
MATSTDDKSCVCTSLSDAAQPPFYSVNYSFGMLLGVDDFQTEYAYHSGKMRLHNQWLHRQGVVWGYGVTLSQPDEQQAGILRVNPGLALDAVGRELHLDAVQCLDIAAWFDKHRNDPAFEFKTDAQTLTFDAHVVIRFKACLTRQVPAFGEPCEGAATTAAYSRVFETVEILLRPGPPPADPLATSEVYHRLRLFFGLDGPASDQQGQIVASDQAVLDSPKDLAHFQRWACLDEIDLAPPSQTEYAIVLASISNIKLKAGNSLTFSQSDPPDLSVRPSHVATPALQDFLCALLGGGQDSQFIRGSVVIDPADANAIVKFTVTKPLQAASVTAVQFSLAFLDPGTPGGGWQILGFDAPVVDAQNLNVTLPPAAGNAQVPAGATIRFLAICSGATPILGANGVPLNNGNDFAFQKQV